MRGLRRLVALLLAASMVTAACGGGGSGDSATATTQPAFTSAEGRFRAEFPEEPDREEQRQTVAGIPLVIITFTSEVDDGAVSVGYVDYPPSVTAAGPRPVLDGVAEGAAANVEGKVVSEKATSYLGHEATDYVVDVQDGKGTATARAFLSGNRLYILQAVENGRRARSDRFELLASSFRLL